MPALPPEWIACLPQLASFRLGSVDAQGRPHVCRALAADALPDGRMLAVVAERAAPRVVAALRATAQVALVMASPRTNRTLHLKGRDAAVAPAQPEHAALVQRCRQALLDDISAFDGFTGAPFVDNWYGAGLHELVAVRFGIDGAWDQTPGPGAGRALDLVAAAS